MMKHFLFVMCVCVCVCMCGKGIDSLFLVVHILLERIFVLKKLGLYLMLLSVGQWYRIWWYLRAKRIQVSHLENYDRKVVVFSGTVLKTNLCPCLYQLGMWFNVSSGHILRDTFSENKSLKCLPCCGKSQCEIRMVIGLNLSTEMWLFSGEKFIYYSHIKCVSEVFHKNSLLAILLVYSTGITL